MKDKYILLVGEGNFSFSASLAASNLKEIQNHRLIATDLKPSPKDIKDELTLKNIQSIKAHKGLVFTDVDARTLCEHEGLQMYRKSIETIIFNFPHVQRKKMHIGANRDLLKDFFQSAGQFIPEDRFDVPVVVTLCCGQSGVNSVEAKPRAWADSWQIVEQATYGNFILSNVEKFIQQDYYTNCGYRDRPNAHFNAEDANKFTFFRREPLLPKDSMGEDLGAMKLLHNLEFLKTLRDFNPLLEIIRDLDVPEETLRLEMKYTSLASPFFHLRIEELDFKSVLEKLPYLIVSPVCDSNNDNKIHDRKLNVKYNDMIVGFVNNNNKLNLNISQIISIKYNLEDNRILYSKYCKFVTDLNICSTDSLYHREHKWDISFWITGENFSYEKFVKYALVVYGLLLKSIQLLEEYMACGDTKISHCYRIIVQSLDLALSRHKANEFHIMFRKLLSNKLDIELR